MSNRFFSVEPVEGKTPRRVFALLDQDSEDWLLLDAVDADWFEELFGQESSFQRWREAAEWAPVHVPEVPRQSGAGHAALRANAGETPLQSTGLANDVFDKCSCEK